MRRLVSAIPILAVLLSTHAAAQEATGALTSGGWTNCILSQQCTKHPVVVDFVGVDGAVTDQKVGFLPFDQDSVLSMLSSDVGANRPEVPKQLLDKVQEAERLQEGLRVVEQRRKTVDAIIRLISKRMRNLDRSDQTYRSLYQTLEILQSVAMRLRDEQGSAYRDYRQLHGSIESSVESTDNRYEHWAGLAFHNYSEVILEAVSTRGQWPVVVNTDSTGSVSIALPQAITWVTANVQVSPYEWLHWSLPVMPGRDSRVELTLENAERRLWFDPVLQIGLGF